MMKAEALSDAKEVAYMKNQVEEAKAQKKQKKCSKAKSNKKEKPWKKLRVNVVDLLLVVDVDEVDEGGFPRRGFWGALVGPPSRSCFYEF